MATISENLQTIKDSTDAIKQAIIDKGGTINGNITTWVDAISGISGGGEEIIFMGTKTWSGMKCTINGNLFLNDNSIQYNARLCMGFRISTGQSVFSSISVSINIKNISLTCDYNEPAIGKETPALFILYLDNYETKLIPVKFIEQIPIKFYVNDIEYDALSPMTWELFINSETYNPQLTDTNGVNYKAFFIENNTVYYTLLDDGNVNNDVYIYSQNSDGSFSLYSPTDNIESNKVYIAD